MVREIDDGKWFAGRGEPNWENEAELERLQEVKRRREEAEPYNDVCMDAETMLRKRNTFL